MNRNSNTYIIVYAAVMVAVVALVLAFAALKLQPQQRANVETEMKGAILQSVGLLDSKAATIDELYAKYIVDAFAVNSAGDKVDGADAFALLGDLKAEYEKTVPERTLPVFVSKDDAGVTRYIIPLQGSGLWGPIWGYLALESDWNTVSGAVFDHKSETPGLGAEIATPVFEDQFKGKTIFDNGVGGALGQFVSVSVLKGGKAAGRAGAEHSVDAISGGTITSRGVDAMLRSNLEGYLPYINKVARTVPVDELATEPAVEPAQDNEPSNNQQDE